MNEVRYQINPNISLGIDLLGYLHCETDWVGTEHFHSFWELVISSFDFEQFQVELFAPNEVHKFENRENCEKHLLYIGFDFKTDPTIPVAKIKAKLLEVCSRESNKDIFSIFLKKLSESEEMLQSSGFYMQVMTFLLNVIDKYMFRITDTTRETALVSEIKKYINGNLDKKIDIQQISKSFYMSPKHIGQIFRKEAGEGILQYVKRKKMEKALLLLKTRDFSITQISDMLGFDNVSFFSASFKSYYGSPPTSFYEIRD